MRWKQNTHNIKTRNHPQNKVKMSENNNSKTVHSCATMTVVENGGAVLRTTTKPVAAMSYQHLTFPWILHDMLEGAEERGYADVVSWIPGTNYFKIHDVNTFLQTIMPIYFNQTRIKSFLRQLNLYCFVRQNKGYHTGSYSHPLFIRGEMHLCRFISRVQNKTKAAAAAAAAATMTQASAVNTNDRVLCDGGGAEERTTRQHRSFELTSEPRGALITATTNNCNSMTFLNFGDAFQDEHDTPVVDDIIDLFGSASMYP